MIPTWTSSSLVRVQNSKFIIPYVFILGHNKILFLCPDFGLSNEEFIESEHGPVHCNTQCGSPAYAAPELLGHKEYVVG